MAGIREMDWEELRGTLGAGGLALVDTRTPKEHANGAIPGSHNLPILDDQERHVVGLTYKTRSSQEAVSVGLELFAAKCEAYLAQIQALAPTGEIAVHCWRGGMRSQLTATWLAACGFRPTLLRGGYKRYRRFVLERLEALGAHPLLVLDGCTGAGKSDLLGSLPADFPKLDLEGLARHRGSAFGDFGRFFGQQPAQQGFENQLVASYEPLAAWPSLLVEIENKIGPVTVPPIVQRAIDAAPIVLVERDFDDRVERLSREYCASWSETFDQLFEERCRMLQAHIKRDDLAKLIAAVRRRDFETVVADLLRLRYDKVYMKGIRRREGRVVARFNLTHEEPAARAWLAERLGYAAQAPVAAAVGAAALSS
jgi:tRNA 2-selenouridine synthase